MADPIIQTTNLRKVFKVAKKQPGVWASISGFFHPQKVEVEAVKGIDITIQPGEVVGFLGPNGAGKTTTLKMLSGIIHPTSGDARVMGYQPWKRDRDMLKRMALVMGNKQQLWWDLPAWDSFLVIKEMYDVDATAFKKRTERLIETLDLSEKVHTQVRKLSLGERMKCELVAALLYDPAVVYLDEPTLGLDVVSQKRIREFLMELHDQSGTTLLLTSHYMQDVQELCERILVIDHGELFYDGTLDKLVSQFSDTRSIRLEFSKPVEESDIRAIGAVAEASATGALLKIPSHEVAQVVAAAMQSLPVQDIAIEETEIEDVIRQLFNREAKEPLSPDPRQNEGQ